MTIQLHIKDGFSVYKIAKELNRPINTILNKIHRDTTTQIKKGRKAEVYLADTGEAIYLKNRQNSHLLKLIQRLWCIIPIHIHHLKKEPMKGIMG